MAAGAGAAFNSAAHWLAKMMVMNRQMIGNVLRRQHVLTPNLSFRFLILRHTRHRVAGGKETMVLQTATFPL
jgi:hypothetical protein